MSYEMIDLHMHTRMSDGRYFPLELAVTAEQRGYRALCFADHADSANMDVVVPGIARVCKDINAYMKIRAIPGVEMTYVPPVILGDQVNWARKLGANLIIVHGETDQEAIMAGTNRAAIEAGVDILAHPGFITEEDCVLAKEKNVLLEISTKDFHYEANRHIVGLAKKHGAKLIMNSDFHRTEHFLCKDLIDRTMINSNLSLSDVEQCFKNSWDLFNSKMG